MWKNTVVSGRPQTTIWRMGISRWIPTATNTLSEYVIFIACLLQQWLHERASMLRYTYIPCSDKLISFLRLAVSLPSLRYTTSLACENWGCHSSDDDDDDVDDDDDDDDWSLMGSYTVPLVNSCRSQWSRGLRRRSTAARMLGLWVRIPPGAWMSVCCECCMLWLVQRNPTDYGASLCVISKPRELETTPLT